MARLITNTIMMIIKVKEVITIEQMKNQRKVLLTTSFTQIRKA